MYVLDYERMFQKCFVRTFVCTVCMLIHMYILEKKLNKINDTKEITIVGVNYLVQLVFK